MLSNFCLQTSVANGCSLDSMFEFLFRLFLVGVVAAPQHLADPQYVKYPPMGRAHGRAYRQFFIPFDATTIHEFIVCV